MSSDSYRLNPAPGFVQIKLTAMLREWMRRLMEENSDQQSVDNIIQSINYYLGHLRGLRAKSKTASVNAVHQALDQLFAKTAEEKKQDIKCKAGCTACCYIDAIVTEDEIEVILDFCRKNNIEIDQAYLTQQAKTGRQVFSEFSRCVFLKDNLCSIYEVRPVACRKHFVKTDPALCDSSKKSDIPVETYFDQHSEILASALLNLSETGPIEKMLIRK